MPAPITLTFVWPIVLQPGDFADGVLGLAYIGTSARGSVGGICEDYTIVNGQLKSLKYWDCYHSEL